MAYSALLSNLKPSTYSRAIPRSSQVPYVTFPRVSSTTSIQSRRIRRYTYHRHGSRSSDERRRLEKYQRHSPSKLRDGEFGHRRQSPHSFDNHHAWWNPGWGWGRWKFSVPPYFNGRTPMDDYWETRRMPLEQRMEQIRKEMEADPYAVLFGRRLEPFKSSDKHENMFSSLFQSIFGHGSKAEAESKATDTSARAKTDAVHPSDPRSSNKQPASPRSEVNTYEELAKDETEAEPKATDTTARVKLDSVHSSDPRPSDKQPTSPGIEVNSYEKLEKDDIGGYEFDPITGRMVRKKGDAREESRNSKDTETPNISIHTNTSQRDDAQSAGFLSPVDRSVQSDAKGFTKAGAHENIVQSGSVEDPSPQSTTQGASEFAYGSDNLPAKPGNSDENVLKGPNEPQEESTAFANEVPASDIETTNERLSTDRALLEAHNVPPSPVSRENERSSSAPMETQNALATPRMTFNEVKQQEVWVTQAEKAEDLDILRASDIRTPYELKNKDQDSEEQSREKRRKLDLAYEMAEDPVRDLDAQRIREKYEILESSQPKETVSEPPESPKPQLRSQTSTAASTSLPPAEDDFHNVSIDPNHVAEEQYNQVQVSPNDSWATTYRVLVYDPSSSQVVEAETSSSLQSTDTLPPPAEVLSRLSNPAKFVPYLAKMQNDGYEIVSGSEDIVVFRQASESGSAIRPKIPSRDRSAAQLASTQSDHDGNIRAATAPSDVSPNPAIVNTAEASQDTDHAKARSRVRTALRRMLIGGAATAGTCYAIGVVVEYFRTGGKDGLGIDGFTEFESERRHRDRE